MEKLYKIGQWLLLYKERMVFIILLGVLCYKVYNVMAKTEEPDEASGQQVIRGPLSKPAPGWYDSDDAPQDPPPPPGEEPKTPHQALVRANPFTVWGFQEQGGEEEELPDDIFLEMIKKWPDGTWRAGIRTRVLRYYQEGEAFESYRVLEIDAANGTVEVYSDRLGKPITLELAR